MIMKIEMRNYGVLILEQKIALALYFKYSARSIMQIALSWGFFRVEQSAHLSTSCFVLKNYNCA